MAESGQTAPIGIVLVTHGQLGEALRRAVEHVVGPQTGIATVCMEPDDDMQAQREAILHSVAAVDAGRGVIVLTDMFGGTPSNLAISIMDKARVEVIAGVNLPMLIKLASIRANAGISEAAAAARDAGRNYIRIASELLGGTG